MSKIAPLNPMALPMALLGLRTHDANAFCAGVGLVADTVLPGQSYGVRYNAMKNAEVLDLFAQVVHSHLESSGTNPIGNAGPIHRMVVVAALRSVVLEWIEHEKDRNNAPYIGVRTKDAQYLLENVVELIRRLNLKEQNYA